MKRYTLRALAILVFSLLTAPLILLLCNGVASLLDDQVLDLAEALAWEYAAGSFYVIAIGLTVGLVFGLWAAYFCARFEFRLRKLMQWAYVLPLAVPAYLVSYAWVDLFEDLGGRASSLRSPGFAGLILGLSSLPYFFLPAYVAFLRIPANCLAVSRMLGGKHWRLKSVFRVEVPLVWPTLFGGLSLASMEILSDFGTVDFLAVDTWTTAIFRRWYGHRDFHGALSLALLLAFIACLMLFFETYMRKRGDEFSLGRSTARASRENVDGFRGFSGIFFLFLPPVFFVLIPLVYLLIRMFTYHGVRSPIRDVWDSLANSLFLALVTGLLVAIIGLIVAAVQRYHPERYWALIARAGTIGYALPGAVVAVSILFIRAELSLVGVWAGITLLIYAHCVRFSAIGSRIIEGAWAQIPQSLEQQSRILGMGPLATLRRVSLPLIKSSIGGAAVLTALDVIKELPASMLLRPFNFETLSIHTYNLASDERLAEVAPTAILMILCGFSALTLAAKWGAFEIEDEV